MKAKLVVPASQRDAFYWQLHAHLDHAETTAQFVDELLSQIGVHGTDHAHVARALRARLPADVDQVDVTLVAAALQENGVLTWTNDLRSVPRDVFGALETAITNVLRSAPRGAMPRPVSDALTSEACRILGDLVDGAARSALDARLVPMLERDLWRRDTKEDELVSAICSAIAEHARITPA